VHFEYALEVICGKLALEEEAFVFGQGVKGGVDGDEEGKLRGVGEVVFDLGREYTIKVG
jgi:hypothetical protein